MAKDIKLDGEQHGKLSAYLYGAAQHGALMVVNVRRKSDNSFVPVLGVMHMTPEGPVFNPVGEINDPDAEDLYYEPVAEDNLPPEPARDPSKLILPSSLNLVGTDGR